MSPPIYDNFFHTATGNTPFDYQRRLACGERDKRPEPEWLAGGTACQSKLIDIPTGLGKTAAVLLAWLWNRAGYSSQAHRDAWPRRLVYCLPMRTLVEQTEHEARKWLQAHGFLWDGKTENRKGKIGVHILMGGEDAGEWDIYPEENAILIGTQDMLLSRALNRGYGMSRYRWPMHFGLLNNDCLWVMDETQLMGVGVETSAQLDGFRHNGEASVFGTCPTWWMSATLDNSRLDTVDHPKPDGGWPTEKLSKAEETSGRACELITATKKLSSTAIVLNPTTKAGYATQLAAFIKDHHQAGTLTLVVVNRVARARDIYEALATGKKPLYAPERVALIHSRFRPLDRERHEKLLFGDKDGKGDRIVIATQAVEAGVDVSARLLITELAPWPSLVQRMGRCNRRADFPDAEVFWVDIQPKDENDDLLLPYNRTELDKARATIETIKDASPKKLSSVTVDREQVIRPVIRRRDLVDLFDTTPDICGQDLDISRYIRDPGDGDVQFFWRDITGETPDKNEPQPERIELCRVTIGDAAKFFRNDKRVRAWRWNPLERNWERAEKPRAGGVYLLDRTSGGYDADLGWTIDAKHQPIPHPPRNGALEAHDDEPDTFGRSWQTIGEHTQQVVGQATTMATLANEAEFGEALRTAALWHDLGKAHEEFQKALRDGNYQPPDANGLYAKSKNPPKRYSRYSTERPYRSIRHELASTLAWLLAAPPDVPERDLVAYLIAAHHGKVRLSIRSLPDEKGPTAPDALFARGIWQDDELPLVPLGELTTPKISLDLSFMQMGEGPHGPSWLARAVALRDRLGPFRLAYLETLLRSADARASRS